MKRWGRRFLVVYLGSELVLGVLLGVLRYAGVV